MQYDLPFFWDANRCRYVSGTTNHGGNTASHLKEYGYAKQL